MTKFEDANFLYEAGTKAIKPSPYKYGTQLFEMNHLLETAKLQRAFQTGTYEPQPGVKFEIKERGHERFITSTATADKAVSHLTCDEYLTPLLEKYLQYDNSASQKGKGVAFHRHRFKVHLRQYYEREGTRMAKSPARSTRKLSPASGESSKPISGWWMMAVWNTARSKTISNHGFAPTTSL